MTDHRILAQQLLDAPALSNGVTPGADVAQVHAILHLAEVLEAQSSDIMDEPTLRAAALGIESPAGEPYHFTVYEEIRQERQKQYAQGWSFEHDMDHGFAHIIGLIESYLPLQPDSPFAAKPPRERLIIVAALAVAGIDLLDGKPSS